MDRRQRKSREAIKYAMLTLMKDKSPNDITITELTTLADVNRKTFYNNYDSITDVRKELETDIVDIMFNLVEEEILGDKMQNITIGIKELLHKFIRIIDEDRQRAKLVFDYKETTYFLRKLHDLLNPYIIEFASEHDMKEYELEYLLYFIASGTASVLNAWIHEEYLTTAAQVEDLLDTMISKLIS